MAQQGLPGLNVDTSDNADQAKNMRRISTWSRSVSPLMFGVSHPLIGTLPVPPTPQDCYLQQSYSPALSFVSGIATTTWPRPFPNGLLSIQIANFSSTANQTTWSFFNYSLAGCDVAFWINGSLYTGGSTMSITVLGW